MIRSKLGVFRLWQKLDAYVSRLRSSCNRQRRWDHRFCFAGRTNKCQGIAALVESLEVRVVLTAPGGAVDAVNPNGTIVGWSFDPDTKNVADSVDLYVDNTFCSRTVTSVSRPDVSGKFGLSINPGFSLTIPPKYENGITHTYTVYAIDTAGPPNPNPPIGTGTFTLQAPVGAVDSVNLNGAISGWSYDPDVKNIANSVDLYVDGTFCSRTQTSVSRPDVSGKFGLSINPGFTIYIPSQYFDNRQHTYTTYAIEGSAGSNMPNPPFATGPFTLAPPKITMLQADLDIVTGKIAYANAPGQQFNYQVILDGGATYTSPASPPDMSNMTDSAGNFTYAYKLPPLRSDGSTSQLHIKAIDPNTRLGTYSASIPFKWPFANTPATSSVNPTYFSSIPTNTNFNGGGTPTYGGVYYYHEWSDLTLQAPLQLTVGAPGDYIGKDTQYPSMQALLSSSSLYPSPNPALVKIPAGAAIDSYYVHSNPPVGVLTYSSGTLWFPNPVIGLITFGPDLQASESTSHLARSNVTYSDDGLEIYVPTGGALDSIRVLSDGHTVQFFLRAAGVDDFRVITQTDPTPSPPPPNQPPQFQGGNSFSIDENQTLIGQVSATDPDGGPSPLSYSVDPTTLDGQFFSISQTGVLSFKFAPDYENPQDSSRDNVYSVNISVSDGTAIVTRQYVVNVLNVNEAPILGGIEGTAFTYSGTVPTIVSSTLTVSDVDSPNLAGATVQISAGYQSGSDSLSFTNTPNITATWESASGTLILSGSDSPANYQAALRSVFFQAMGTSTAARTFSFQVSDGSLLSNIVSRAADAPPFVVSIVPAGPNPTTGPAVQFTVTFSESVSGVDSTDFSLATSGNVSATLLQVTAVSASVYTVTVGGVTGAGTLGVNLVNDGSIADLNSNPLTGNFTGQVVTVVTVPVVTTQPSNATVTAGSTVNFTAAASGSPTPTVQWQVSNNAGGTWTNIPGATLTTYSFTAASGDSGSQYRAIFTNAVGTATTNAATLTVALANVLNTSVRWGTSGTATLVDASGSRLLSSGRTNDIDWFNISSISIALDRSISALAPGDISVIGSIGGSYGPVTVSGSGTTWVITLAKVIANADKVNVTIGNAQLTGYQRELDVLPGDFNDDGVVSSADVTLLNNATVAPYNLFADLNGDGLVDTNDGKLARAKIGTKRII